MIDLPPGFDAPLFYSDLMGIVAAVAPVFLILAAYMLIKRIIRSIG